MLKSAMTIKSHASTLSSPSIATDSTSKSTSTIRIRLLVSLLVLITMGLLCQLCQILCTTSGTMSKVAGAACLFIAFYGHVWMGIHSNALTRARKAFFDEANVLETYQPRARTMGHLFCPEPPTPAPTVKFSETSDENQPKHTAEENAAFNAMRDSHYANMFEYAMKMQRELQAMEKNSQKSEQLQTSPAGASEVQSDLSQSPGGQPSSLVEKSPGDKKSANQGASDKSSSSSSTFI